jgi:hypothetical protein
VRGVSADWSIESITWAVQPAAQEVLGSVILTPGAWATLELTDAAADNGLVLTAARPGAASWTRLVARDQSDVMAFGPRLVLTWRAALPPEWLVAKVAAANLE